MGYALTISGIGDGSQTERTWASEQALGSVPAKERATPNKETVLPGDNNPDPRNNVTAVSNNPQIVIAEPGDSPSSSPRRKARLLAQKVWPELVSETGSAAQSALTFLGQNVPIQVVPEPSLLTRDGLSDSRSTETEQRTLQERDALWLQSRGILRQCSTETPLGYWRKSGLDHRLFDATTDQMYVGWAGDARYTFELPVEFDPSHPTANDLRTSLKPMTQMPLSAAVAMEVPTGARMILEGRGFMGEAKQRGQVGGVHVEPEQEVRLQVDWLGERRVRVAFLYRHRSNIIDETLDSVDSLKCSLLHRQTFDELDLSHEKDRRVYEKLLQLEVDEAGVKAAHSREGRAFELPLNAKFDLFKSDEEIFNLGIEFCHAEIPANDRRIQDDAFRASLVGEAMRDNRELHWLETMGELRLRNDFYPISTPKSPVTFQAGVRAGGNVSFALLLPWETEPGATTGKAIREMTKQSRKAVAQFVKAVFTRKKKLIQKAFPPGTTLVLQGALGTSLLARLSAGGRVPVGSKLELAASAGVNVDLKGHHDELEVMLEWQRDGSISVEVRDTQVWSSRIALGGELGPKVDKDEILDELAIETLADWLSVDALSHTAAEQTISQLERLARLKAEVLWDRQKWNTDQALYGTFDPANEEDADVLLDLVNPFLKPEDRPDPSMVIKTREERKLDGTKIRALGVGVDLTTRRTITLMEFRAVEGTELVGEAHDGQKKRKILSRHIFPETNSSFSVVSYQVDPELIGGMKVPPHGLEDGQLTYLEFTHDGRDPRVSQQEIDFWVPTLAILGGNVCEETPLPDRNVGGYFSKYGEGEFKFCLYVSEEGIRRVARADEQRIIDAFAEVLGQQHPTEIPAWANPDHRALARGYYAQAQRLLNFNTDAARQQLTDLQAQYQAKFGCPLHRDMRYFEQAKTLIDALAGFDDDALNPSKVPKTIDLLRELGERTIGRKAPGFRRKEFFFTAVATLAVIAGNGAMLRTGEVRTKTGMHARNGMAPEGLPEDWRRIIERARDEARQAVHPSSR